MDVVRIGSPPSRTPAPRRCIRSVFALWFGAYQRGARVGMAGLPTRTTSVGRLTIPTPVFRSVVHEARPRAKLLEAGRGGEDAQVFVAAADDLEADGGAADHAGGH